jgi:hypothetical protein
MVNAFSIPTFNAHFPAHKRMFYIPPVITRTVASVSRDSGWPDSECRGPNALSVRRSM